MFQITIKKCAKFLETLAIIKDTFRNSCCIFCIFQTSPVAEKNIQATTKKSPNHKLDKYYFVQDTEKIQRCTELRIFLKS